MTTRSAAHSGPPSRAGFRLARFEVLNWGTFHGRIWRIEPGGENALLTGDIGSGKSTLVDAMTTLLVPPRKITYNRAAGAEARERSLYSYVRGEYRTVSNEHTGSAQAQALRDENCYSVILAVFADAAANREVTLALVLWTRPGERTPERFYVVAAGALSIADDFTEFGADLAVLKKRLRADERVKRPFESFEEYATQLRRELGIPHAQALELFYQTVSMKSVGNLTEFVRHHMLEPDDTDDRIRALIGNFENLSRAHDAVVRARSQIEMLEPLVADGDKLQAVESEVTSKRRAREVLAAWFAGHRIVLLGAYLENLSFERDKTEQRLAACKARVDALARDRADLQVAIARQGGDRLTELEREIRLRQTERDRQRADDEYYRRTCAQLELRPGHTLETFLGTTRAAEQRRGQIEAQRQSLDRAAVDKGVEFVTASERDKQLTEETRSLEGRANNLPITSIRIRDSLAAALGVDAEELPFVGEHLQVRDTSRDWEGAIERLLHGFALSLLVPESLHAQVSHYVDRTHLQGRLVYLRIRASSVRPSARSISTQSVVRKIEIKPDSAFHEFLARELAESFDYACCESLEEFNRLPRALRASGQIKSNERRHEKDDRHGIGDRTRYVLGWDNQAKLELLRAERAQVRRRLVAINEERSRIKAQREEQDRKLRVAEALRELTDFARIDWRGTASLIARLEDEKRSLETSDDLLRTLRERRDALDEEYRRADDERGEADRKLGGIADRMDDARAEREAALAERATIAQEEFVANDALLAQWCAQVLGEQPLELRLLPTQQKALREALQARIDAEERTASRLREKIVEQMQRYKAAYPAETTEMDASTAALTEYRRQLASLREDDLPRFRARFKELLNKETINGMAAFQAHLQRRRDDIERRIRTINVSLTSIEYDRIHGTYIELVSLPAPDVDVRNFQTDLRECISGGGDQAELYSEQKFLQVKALVERLNGREGQADLDARWRAKVADVRNWFEFGAKERWRADDAEREFYRDSSGKSGGQKEKLAYTILAAALAYQFGLADSEARQRHFRFVVIDEAFGRGSDDSTRYGLELFAGLDLQLLIVTPLQKIAVIEDYIAAVHFVHNEGGSNSQVQTLTIEQYRERKEQFSSQAASVG
ncbi:ATP-binding protein [Steroidobacter flavus]|uniref:ATP-binding protein n=1 Tax=Steroidobacter flavus TaxID=1842136 RepID=A0ABV8T2R6_9GAMM